MENREQVMQKDSLLLTHMYTERGYSRVFIISKAKENGGIEMRVMLFRLRPAEMSNN